MRIIGIDPGLATVGYAILEVVSTDSIQLLDCGILSTKPSFPIPERLSQIRVDLCSLFAQYKPSAAAVELLYFAKNIKTAIAVAQARGVILESLVHHGITSILELTPTQLKQTLTGNGQADKKYMQMMVSQTLGLEDIIRPDDAADAVALAIAYHRQMRSQVSHAI